MEHLNLQQWEKICENMVDLEKNHEIIHTATPHLEECKLYRRQLERIFPDDRFLQLRTTYMCQFTKIPRQKKLIEYLLNPLKQ